MKKLLLSLALLNFGAFAQTSVVGNGLTYSNGNVSVGTRVLPDFTVDVRTQGAKGDQRFVYDAAITAGSSTLTSATAAFTADDNARVFTVNMGAQIMAYATYTSGGSITGSKGQTCSLTAFNGAANVAATVYLTGTNAITASSYAFLTNVGAAITTAPTSATLGNGTATCSGTAVIHSTLFAAPVQTTGTVVNATTVTLGVAATTTVSSARAYVGTDDTAAIQAAINLAGAKGGGVYIPIASGCPTSWTGQCSYLMLGQLTIPSIAVSPNPANTYFAALMSKSIHIFGDGASFQFPDASSNPPGDIYGGTVLDMRYAGTVAKIPALAGGTLEVDHLTLTDFGYDALPYFEIENTTANIHDVYFDDNPYFDGWHAGTPIKDAILTGDLVGTNFWGIGVTIERCGFERIRRGIWLRGWSLGYVIRNNSWYAHTGGDATVGAIEIDAGSQAANTATGNKISDNHIVLLGYVYGIRLTKTTQNSLTNNSFGDWGVPTSKLVYFDSGAAQNTVVGLAGFYSLCGEYQSISDATNSVLLTDGSGLRACNPLNANADLSIPWTTLGVALTVNYASIAAAKSPFTVISTAASPSIGLFSSYVQTGNRNWAWILNNSAYGDICLKQSTAAYGDPVAAGACKLTVNPDGTVTAPAYAGTGSAMACIDASGKITRSVNGTTCP